MTELDLKHRNNLCMAKSELVQSHTINTQYLGPVIHPFHDTRFIYKQGEEQAIQFYSEYLVQNFVIPLDPSYNLSVTKFY